MTLGGGYHSSKKPPPNPFKGRGSFHVSKTASTRQAPPTLSKGWGTYHELLQERKKKGKES